VRAPAIWPICTSRGRRYGFVTAQPYELAITIARPPRPLAAQWGTVPNRRRNLHRPAGRRHPERPRQAHAVRSLATREGLNLKRGVLLLRPLQRRAVLSLSDGRGDHRQPHCATTARNAAGKSATSRTARKAARIIGVPSAVFGPGRGGRRTGSRWSYRGNSLINCGAENHMSWESSACHSPAPKT